MDSTPRRRSLGERVRWLAGAAIVVLLAGAYWTMLALLALVLWLIPQLPHLPSR